MAHISNTYKPIISDYGKSHYKEAKDFNDSDIHQNISGDIHRKLNDIQEDFQQRLTDERAERSKAGLEEKIQLRDDQTKIVRELLENYARSALRLMLFGPTGMGKTIVISELARILSAQGKRIAILVHRDELVFQTLNKLKIFGIIPAVVKAGHRERPNALVQIISIQTLNYRPHWFKKFDVIICDEAHLTRFTKAAKKLHNINPQALQVGATATPYRSSPSKGTFGDCYDIVAGDKTTADLIEDGALIQPVYFSIPTCDLSQVKKSGQDYQQGSLGRAMGRLTRVLIAYENWMRIAGPTRRTAFFASSVSHAKRVFAVFTRRGVSCALVTGKTPTAERQEIYRKLADGEISVLISIGVLCEGFDCPPVDCIFLGRPTQSFALAIQMIGRGLRRSPRTNKTDCLILDQAEITSEFGFVEDIGIPTLSQSEDKKKGKAPVKNCPDCSRVLHCSVMTCPNCGHEFQRKIAKKPVETKMQRVEGELSEPEKTLRQLIVRCCKANFNPGWILIHYRKKYGRWPCNAWFRGRFTGSNPSRESVKRFVGYLEDKLLPDNEEAFEKWLSREFGPQWRQVMQSLQQEVA